MGNTHIEKGESEPDDKNIENQIGSTRKDSRHIDQSNAVKIVVIGCGMRGRLYSEYALENPALCKVVAICEPIEKIAQMMKKLHNLEDDKVFKSYQDLLDKHNDEKQRIADAVLICTQDRDHEKPAVAFANLGYHILLEKPMAQTLQECKNIVNAVKKNNVHFAVCHVLRYSIETQAIMKLLRGEKIGQILTIQHMEPIGFWHYGHSYVRGNWHSTKDSNFILMTKSCHDIDLISYYMNSKCVKVSSFGTLTHFTKENKPERAAKRCLDCPKDIEEICPYSAKGMYLGSLSSWSYPLLKNGEDLTQENVKKALKEGPYGVCVYESENDVCDNQVVNMQFENGATASFTMISTSKAVCVRKTNIFGSKGEIRIQGNKVEHIDFTNGKYQVINTKIPLDEMRTNLTGHGYADYYLMKNFINSILKKDKSLILSNADSTLETHELCFLAEESRLKNTVINVK